MNLILIIVAIVEALVISALLIRRAKPRYDGAIVLTETESKKLFSLEIDRDPDTLDQQKRIVLEVKTLEQAGPRE